jgi:lipocalin
MHFIIALNLLLGVCASSNNEIKEPHHRWINPDTVDELDLDSYSGRWYQVRFKFMFISSFFWL